MGKGPKTTTTSSQTRDPWAPAQPLLKDIIGGMGNWLKDPNTFKTYDGKTLADQSEFTKMGLGMLGAGNGYNEASDYYRKVLGGGFINQNNEYVEGLKNAITSSVMPGVNATFAKAGMTGSTQHQGMLAKGLTEGMAPALYQNYLNERNAMGQAAMALPGMERQRAMDTIMAGGMQDAYGQAKLNDDRDRWERERMAGIMPYLQIAPTAMNIGNLGGTSFGTQTQQTQTPGWQTGLGLGMMGLGMLGGMPGLGMMGGMGSGFGNFMMGAPWGYGSSWTPWTQKY